MSEKPQTYRFRYRWKDGSEIEIEGDKKFVEDFYLEWKEKPNKYKDGE